MTTPTTMHAHTSCSPREPRATDLGFLNLTFLMALREAAARDATRACYQYGLSKDDLAQFARLSVEAIQSIARQMDQSMVTLRFSVNDLRELSALPSGVAVLLAPSRAQ